MASKNLTNQFISILENLRENHTFYAHNLGSFDGYFVLRDLLAHQPKILIDDQNSIITMSIKNKFNKTITFKDSLRILPRSLADLSDIYDVKKKKTAFSHDSVTLNKILYNNKFKASLKYYLTNDCRSLEKILYKGASYLLNTYNVSFLDVFSTASMAMKIFRTKFMGKGINEIPILPKAYDKVIRKSYYGGIVNIFIPKGKKLFFYDVNSLYPYGMKEAMPGKLIKSHFGQINTKNFFGFIYAQVIIPKTHKISYAPIKINNTLISPVGKIKGLYFSEELKAFKEWGYEVKTIFGFEHEKIYPFNDYVNHFYELKKTAKGSADRYITKLLLNGLYGFFGRKPVEEIIEVVPQNKMNWYLRRYDTRLTIGFDESNYVIIKRNILPDKELYKTFNINYNELMKESQEIGSTNSNVAIASAITAYARIRIHNLINQCEGKIYYMDTDSIYTDMPISEHLLSDELGDLKDELKGDIISEAYFVAPKVYGFKQEKTLQPTIKAKSIKKDQITFDHIKNLYNGETLQFPVKRFFKNIESLSLLEKSFNVTISRDESNSKRINVYDYSGNWVDTKPIVLNQKMTWFEYWMHKGWFLPKNYFLQLIQLKFKE